MSKNIDLDLGTIGYTTTVDDKQYYKSLTGMEKQASSTGAKIMKALSFMAGITMFKKFVQAASDLNEVENKFATVFASVRKEADKTNKELQKLYGLGKTQSTTMLSGTGDLLTGLGFNANEALKLSNSVQKLAVDLASFSNYAGGATGASEALTKGLLGETEMMKGLAIVINQNSQRFKELMRDNVENKGMTEMQAKAYSVLTMAMEQSQNAIGDYGRTANSFANRYRKNIENSKDAIADLGRQLIPVAQKIITVFNKMLKVTTMFNGGILRTISYLTVVGLTVKGLHKLQIFFTGIKIAIDKATLSSAANTAATTTNAAAQGILAKTLFLVKGAFMRLWAVMLANPFTAVAVAGAAVLAIIVSIMDGISEAEEQQRQKLAQELESAQKQREASRKQREDSDQLLQRLNQINKKEKLNNLERQEQAKILNTLKSRHKDFNAEIDKATGKINNLTKVMKKLQQILEKEKNTQIKNEIEKTELLINSLNKKNSDLTGYKNNNLWSQISGAQEDNILEIEKNSNQIQSLMLKIKNLKKELKGLSPEEQKYIDATQAQSSYDSYTKDYEKSKKSEYQKENEQLKNELDQQLENLETMRQAKAWSKNDQENLANYEKEVAKLKEIYKLKKDALEIEKQKSIEAEKQAQIDKQKREAEEQKRKEQQEFEVSQTLEMKKLEAEAWADGKLTAEEKKALKNKELEQLKEQQEMLEKQAEELDGIAKKQAESALLNLDIEIGKLNGEIASLLKENKDPQQKIQAQGGFFAKQVMMMNVNQEDYNKTTAEHTKDIRDIANNIHREIAMPNATTIQLASDY
ncbi:hypothetical protein AAEX28_02365 [Lentisphaerota bacterium WC36G]|nr:hypothetical protein LJT99_05250 [Lentisphaerae bacterium WC36]